MTTVLAYIPLPPALLFHPLLHIPFILFYYFSHPRRPLLLFPCARAGLD